MFNPTQHSYHDNGLDLGKHALLLFISIVISFVLHFAMAFCYDNFFAGALLQQSGDPDGDGDGNVTPMQFLDASEFVNVALAAEEIAPDANQATETVEVHKTAAESLTEEVVDTDKLLPDQIDLSELGEFAQIQFDNIHGDTQIDLPAPMKDLAFDQTIDVPQLTIEEAQYRVDEELVKKEVQDQALLPIPEGTSYVDINKTEDTIEHFKPAGDSTKPTVLSDVAQQHLEAQSATFDAASEALAREKMSDILDPRNFSVSSDEEMLAKVVEGLQPTLSNEMGDAQPNFIPIDKSLSVALTLYEAPEDPSSYYYMIQIKNRGEIGQKGSLQIMPKDVVFIQDVSGSIGRRRLEYCKAALKSALYRTLRNGDRFTIFAFRDMTLTPDASWMTFNSEDRAKTDVFIDSLRAKGNTDIFSLLSQDLPTLDRDPNRPLIAVIITDGEATAGETETAKIIGEFTRINQGNIAIYTLNARKMNPYFLDMLCYTNRGENFSSSGDPDDIEEEMYPIFDRIYTPIMKDVELSFGSQNTNDIHPKNLTHLFAGSPLVVYGRVPKTTTSVKCHLTGKSMTSNYDAVFTFDLKHAKVTDDDLRAEWAKRAMFDMLADYAANPSEGLRREIEIFSRVYGVKNPYPSIEKTK